MGAVYCWGQNGYGQIGVGTMTEAVFSPQLVKNLGAVKQLASGDRFSCAITADTGALFCWGQAIFGVPGSTGPYDLTGVVYPSYVPGLEGMDIIQLALGQVHLCVLNAQKKVYCWGYNDFGQCGQPFNPKQTTDAATFVKAPHLVPNLPPVQQLSGGWRSTCALLESGEVMCWGHAGWSELGVKMGDGQWESSTNIPQYVPSIKNAKAISSGWAQTCAITENGAVACWGNFPYWVNPSSPFPQCMTFK
jgi:alpha-tubulin suppressor-like RCC1 family protein